MAAPNYHNEHCALAAAMLETETGLLDYRLVEFLNQIANYVKATSGELVSRQVVALAVATWENSMAGADNFTKKPQH